MAFWGLTVCKSWCDSHGNVKDGWGIVVRLEGRGTVTLRQSKKNCVSPDDWELWIYTKACSLVFLICWSNFLMSKLFYQSLRLFDSIIWPLPTWDSLIQLADLCFPVYQNLREKCPYVYSALYKPKYIKIINAWNGDDLVFKIILSLMKGLCKYS